MCRLTSGEVDTPRIKLSPDMNRLLFFVRIYSAREYEREIHLSEMVLSNLPLYLIKYIFINLVSVYRAQIRYIMVP